MIKLQIVGNLGKDCIVKEVNGKNVINFSVAHTERYKDQQGNQKERTTWVECAYWTDRTAVSQYLKRGQMVYAEGSPEADAYMNKENVATGTLRMRVQSLQLLGSNKENPGGEGSNAGNVSNAGYNNPPVVKTTTDSSNSSAAMDDDLPF